MKSIVTRHPEILLNHLDFVRGLARSLLFDEHQVDEVVQQTWLCAMESGPREPGAIRNFLRKVVRGRASNLRRDEMRLKAREAHAAVRGLDSVPSTAEVVEREALRRQLVAAVLELCEPYRSTVLRRYFDNQTPAQIARRLGLPAATVRTRLRRALERLRAALDAEHGGDRRAWCLLLLPLAAGAELATRLPLVAATAAVLVLGLGAFAIRADQEPTARAPLSESPLASKAEAASSTVPEVKRGGPILQRQEILPQAGEQSVAFRGRLLRPDGSPAVGRHVRVSVFAPDRLVLDALAQPRGKKRRRLGIGSGRAQTNLEGAFEVNGLWPDSYYILHVLHTDSAHGTQLTRLIGETPAAGDSVDLGTLHLESAGSISGRVANAEGEPVAGALVWCTDMGFVVTALGMERADPAGGLILTHKGAQASVHLFPNWVRELADSIGLPNTRSEPSGRFVLRGVQPGAQHVVVHASELRPFSRPRVRVRPGKDRDLGRIDLNEGKEVHGKVVDAKDRPVVGAEVIAASMAGAPIRGLPEIRFTTPVHRTDAKGAFSLVGLPRGAVTMVTAMGPGEAIVTLHHPRLGSSMHKLVLPKDEHLVKLPQVATLRGKARAGSQTLHPDRWRLGLVRLDGIDPMGAQGRISWLRLDPAGAFNAGGLAPGRYRIQTVLSPADVRSLRSAYAYVKRRWKNSYPPRFATELEIRPGLNDAVEIDVDARFANDTEHPIRVHGSVIIDGRPAAGCQIRFYPWGMWVTAADRRRADVDATGKFDLGRLAWGKYSLNLHDREGQRLCRRHLDLRDGAQTDLRFELVTAQVSGRVSTADGSPAPGLAIRFIGASFVDFGVRTGEAGGFQSPKVMTGEYRVWVIDPELGYWTGQVEVRPEAAPIHITLRKFVSIHGRVDLTSLGLRVDDQPKVVIQQLGLAQRVAVQADGSFVLAAAIRGKVVIELAAMTLMEDGRRHLRLQPMDLELGGRIVAKDRKGLMRGCQVTVPEKGLEGLRIVAPR